MKDVCKKISFLDKDDDKLFLRWRLNNFLNKGFLELPSKPINIQLFLKERYWFYPNRLLSTIDGNVVFVLSQYSCILTSQVLTQYVSHKIIDNIDNFRIKSLSQWKRCNFMCCLFSVFTLFYLILKNMSNNGRKFRFPCYIWHLWRRV